MKHQLTVLLLVVSAVACSQDKTQRSETAWEKREGATQSGTQNRANEEMARGEGSEERERVRGEDGRGAADRERSSEEALRSENASEDLDRDQRGASDTPMDQGESQSDVSVTQDIRRALMDNAELSFTAKNVKVITRDGRVTLRGAVESERERILVENTAKSRMGVMMVRNELEVVGAE